MLASNKTEKEISRKAIQKIHNRKKHKKFRPLKAIKWFIKLMRGEL